MKIIGNIWWFLGWYVFLYPFALSIVWSILGFYFWWRRERNPDKEKKEWPNLWPPVTILIPCHNESAGIASICTSLQLLNYPDYQVIFIDDASTDDTAAAIRHFLPDNPNFHLLSLTKNCGKAQALNYALATVVTASITVVIDADTILTPDALKYLVAPFSSQPRLGAVTGNPLAVKRISILEKLQAAEFASIIGLIKRSQRVIGRVLTVSGCATAYRTEVLKEVGGFSFKTATEDIDITWKIQRHFYEVWFAPQAAVFIQCPSTFKEYWKQRRRWALGGWHLLRTHKDIFKNLKWRYLYPTYLEFVLSTFWAFVFVFGTIYWLITYFLKLSPIGFSPIPAWYGALISIVCIFQMAIALFLNHRYDPKLYRTFFWIPWYPIFFFAFGAITIVWTAPKGLFGSLENVGRWKSPKRQVANS
ncbi:glycosyltransferase [Aceticella autotrophica]|uniref:Glycosyltransferase n=1 Tax=Aceticella autotrophica TaxID=2755338 RepID=A0A975AUY4_9THEO|nr:glycosyltransferase [Aceticella autotrophica]QSZ26908.1 glycosyltransferase [Aceticella autotrophica]